MIVDPPPTQQELLDLRKAVRSNISEVEFMNNQGWYETWFHYLIGLRRGYQSRFLTEAYNEQSSSS
jgi:hypothetical protein